jgi:hypothetical protein
MEVLRHFFQNFLVWLWATLGLTRDAHFRTKLENTNPPANKLAISDFVIVESGGHLKWACFKCPCGCGDKISLSLATNRRPAWSVVVDWKGRPTVTPSVWQKAGCFSHFWITDGRVNWCKDSGER